MVHHQMVAFRVAKIVRTTQIGEEMPTWPVKGQKKLAKETCKNFLNKTIGFGRRWSSTRKQLKQPTPRSRPTLP